MFSKLDYEGIKFPVSGRDYCKIERQNNICINVLKTIIVLMCFVMRIN